MTSTFPDNFSFPKRENSVQLSLIVREIFSRSRIQSDVFLFLDILLFQSILIPVVLFRIVFSIICIFYVFFWNTINKFLYKLRRIQIFFAIFLSFFLILYLNERKYEIEKTNFLFSSE